MKYRKKVKYAHWVLYMILLVVGLKSWAWTETVNWQGPSGSKIKEIRYFKKDTASPTVMDLTKQTEPIELSYSNVIDSPPVDGFVPWIVLTPTNESINAETTGIYEAFPSSYIGTPPSGTNPRTDFFIGIFDTGASAHVIGYENAVRAGLYNSSYLTENNYVEVTGVTGSVDAHVTWPYAMFMAGLDALEPNTLGDSEMVLPSTAGMLGQYNVATLIGQNPGSNPDLATAIGSPMSVFYDTHIRVGQPVTVTHDGTEYVSPRITFYEKDSPGPSYPNYVPLELKPLGAVNVQYITYGFDPEDLLSGNFELDYSPLTPSIIAGNLSQSLFFIHGVDLAENGLQAHDKNRFMLDTGAQVTVIGTRVAARLKLHPDNRDFEVEIVGVTGNSIMAPGFYLDSLTIPAVGQWLEFTNVPVILLDISSPEGGKLDGIIGMNLFTQYNLILRGGGFMLQDDPRLEFERIPIGPVTGDIAPSSGDGKVDLLDFSVFSQSWMADDSDPQWNADADFILTGTSEGLIDLQDLSVLAENWLKGVSW